MRLSTPQLMWLTFAALLPGALAAALAWSPAVLLQVAAGAGFAIAAERAMLALRGNPPGEDALDGSAAVAGAIIGLSVAPLAPVWVAAAAAAFGICLAKHCYGGLGANVFNPAMVGYAFAYLAFPREFTAWPASDLPWTDALDMALGGAPVDGIAGPTILEKGSSAIAMRPAAIAPAVLYALGGCLLVVLRIADWRLAFPFLFGVILVAALATPGDWDRVAGHLLAGGTMMAAFFVITEPVSAPGRRGNRIAYSLLAGMLVAVVREWGSHPDGIAFAVLFANMLAPAMDRMIPAASRRRSRGRA